MTENLTHEAIAQLRARIAELEAELVEFDNLKEYVTDRFPYAADVETTTEFASPIECIDYAVSDVMHLRAENARLRDQVKAEVVVRHACIDALAEAGCSGAGIQEHVGDALSKLRALREKVECTEAALRELTRQAETNKRNWHVSVISGLMRELGLWREPQPATPPAEEE